MALKSDTKSVNAQCQVVVFPWVNETIDDTMATADVAKSSPIDVSADLSEASFEKDNGEAAGSFSFVLQNTRDWKETIKPGHWALIYLTNDGDLKLPQKTTGDELPAPDLNQLLRQKNRLRAICYVERVAVRATTTEEGALDLMYEVSGRDFGIVYEETTIWHNFFLFESGIIDAAVTQLQARGPQTVDQLLQIIHALFYSPSDFPSLQNRNPLDTSQHTLSQVGFQWLLPIEMLQALGLSLRSGKSTSFYGHIDGLLNFDETKATYPIENPMSTLNGNAWEKLKAYSIQQFHELFTEINEDGAPELIFRPIPWKTNPSGYPLIAPFVDSLLDLDGLTVNAIDVVDFDLGQDNHSRYNHFYTSVQTADYSAFDNITELQYPSPSNRTFPFAQVNAIARYGFKPMHVEVNALVQLGLNVDGKADQAILVQYNELIYDYWSNSIFFESGTVNLIGNNAVKLGRTLTFGSDCPYNANKIFYIEGYSDHFEVLEKGVGEWTQTVKVTRGADQNAIANSLGQLGNNNQFSKRNQPFNEIGSFTRK